MEKSPAPLSRRTLLGASAIQSILHAQAPQPAVRFGLVTDVHHADKPERGTRYYRESLQKLTEAVSRFRKFGVDFQIELGDLVDAAQDLDTERAWLRHAVSVLRQSGADTHCVLGNHCVQTLSKQQVLSELGRERSYYSFDRAGIHFVVLDACYRKDGVPYNAGNFDWKDTDIPAVEREWLRQDLAAAAGPAIVFAHQRLDVEDVHGVASAGQVRRILEESSRVSAVFQGHSHQNDHREISGIHYCTMRGLIEGSGVENNGYSIISVFADGRLRVEGFRTQRAYELTPSSARGREK